MLDGKKMKRGTDVDLLGCEKGDTLRSKIAKKMKSKRTLPQCNKGHIIYPEHNKYCT